MTTSENSTMRDDSSTTADRLMTNRSGWRSRYLQLVHTRLFVTLAVLALVIVGLTANGLLLYRNPESVEPLLFLLLLLMASGLIVIGLLVYRLQWNLLIPLANLRHWAIRMEGGDYSARVPIPRRGEFAELAQHINALAHELQNLKGDLDSRVRMQTGRLAQKSRSLEILYDVAATINGSRDLDDLLNRFLYTIKDLTDARAAAIRIVTTEGMMRLVGSVGLDEEIVEKEALVPADRCLCGLSLSENRALCQKDISQCEEWLGRPLFKSDGIEMLAVPMQYRNRDLGVYNLYLDKVGIGISSDTRELLTSIGRHMGMAIEKARLDQTSQRLSLMEERNTLAHELHDSLAQTIASMRFQFSMLEDSLQKTSEHKELPELLRLKNSLDEAHTELRELLSQFRTPLDERGLQPTLKEVIERFKSDTGIATFLHTECVHLDLPPLFEMQIVRIVQESLANIRKHAQATAVRVLLRCDNSGTHLVLIEDDGVGFGEQVLSGNPGEHVGLSIMQERARKLNGELRIESEQGEGTRIELKFLYGDQKSNRQEAAS